VKWNDSKRFLHELRESGDKLPHVPSGVWWNVPTEAAAGEAT